MRESQVRNMPDMPTQMWAVYEEMKQRRERGGWRAVGRLMKVSGAYARQLARGEKPITPTLARAWLEGTQQITQTAIAPVCPDCGNVHTGRCHGKPVAAVVTLAPGETVVQAQPARRKRVVTGKVTGRMDDDDYAWHNARRAELGLTWRGYMKFMRYGEAEG